MAGQILFVPRSLGVQTDALQLQKYPERVEQVLTPKLQRQVQTGPSQSRSPSNPWVR